MIAEQSKKRQRAFEITLIESTQQSRHVFHASPFSGSAVIRVDSFRFATISIKALNACGTRAHRMLIW
jgi:hypothetical protein